MRGGITSNAIQNIIFSQLNGNLITNLVMSIFFDSHNSFNIVGKFVKEVEIQLNNKYSHSGSKLYI